MKTVIFLIIVSATPGTCALIQVDESTYSAVRVETIEECEAQAAILTKAEGQVAFCVDG